jgi:hypothetical protein
MDLTCWGKGRWGTLRRDGYIMDHPCGMAACVGLGVLALTDEDSDTVGVYSLEASLREDRLLRICTLGGGPLPQQFGPFNPDYDYDDDGSSTRLFLAFTCQTGTDSQRPLLLVSDGDRGEVHVVDVVDGSHVGFVGGKGGVPRAGGVAGWKGRKAAVMQGDRVLVFHGGGGSWDLARVVAADASHPRIRFMPCGTRIAVLRYWGDTADSGVSVYGVDSGAVEERVRPYDHLVDRLLHMKDFDISDCGGWVLLRDDFVGPVWYMPHSTADAQKLPSETRLSRGHSIEVVPGVGLMVRCSSASVSVLETPAVMAQAAMSRLRVAWMGAVARVVLDRARRQTAAAGGGDRGKRQRRCGK